MARKSIFACAVALVAAATVCAAADDGSDNSPPSLSLEYKSTYYYDKTTVLNFENQPVVEWAANQTQPYYKLETPAWLFEPKTGTTGLRYSKMRVTFGKGCKDALKVSTAKFNPSLRLLIYPYAYPSISPNLTSAQQELPSFAQEVTYLSFGDADTLTYEFSAGELFVGFRCCLSVYVRSNGTYRIEQTNLSGCPVTVEGSGDTVLVSSLKLFIGTLVLILIPALLTIITHCAMAARQRNKPEGSKTEAQYKATSCKCRVFWISWIIAFGVYIGIILVPMY